MHRSVVLALALLVLAAFAALVYRGAHDHQARAASHALRDAVRAEAEAGGALPTEARVVETRVLAVLPGPTVTYRPAGDGCLIHHEAWPLGPTRALDCASGAWRVIRP